MLQGHLHTPQLRTFPLRRTPPRAPPAPKRRSQPVLLLPIPAPPFLTLSAFLLPSSCELGSMPRARFPSLRQLPRTHRLTRAASKHSRCRTRIHREHSRNAFHRCSHVFAILPSFPTFLPCFCHILQVITADEHANRRHPMPRGTPAQYQKRSYNLCFLRPPDGPPHAHTQPARTP